MLAIIPFITITRDDIQNSILAGTIYLIFAHVNTMSCEFHRKVLGIGFQCLNCHTNLHQMHCSCLMCLITLKITTCNLEGWNSGTTITYIYVTGSTKTGLIAHDCRFDFSSQTQSFMNTLSNFAIIVMHPGLSGLPKPTGDSMGTLTWRLGQPGIGCVWLYSFAVLNNDL